MSAGGTVMRELAGFVAEGDVPESALHAARRTVANATCLVIGSAGAPAVDQAAAMVDSLATPPRSPILGRDQRASVPWAAFVMGVAAHLEDFDDTHLRTIIHPGAPVPPAAIALGSNLGRDTVAVAVAVAVGVEAMLRLGNAICPQHFERGWHLTATMGPVGVAATAARLLELDAATTRHAMGLALVQAGGTQAVLGTMAKPFHPGRAALHGLEAANLAGQGLTLPSNVLEEYAHAHSDTPDLSQVVVGLGSSWELESNAFKPYSCGIVAHPLIDGGIALRDRIPAAADIESIEVQANPWVLVAMGLEDPQHGLESKFSSYHAMAAGYLHGRAGPAEFSDELARDPELVALRRRIAITGDDRIPRDAAILAATDRSGRLHEIRIDHATGSIERPMTDDQLREKGRGELERRLSAAAAADLLDLLFDPGARQLDELTELATPLPRAAEGGSDGNGG